MKNNGRRAVATGLALAVTLASGCGAGPAVMPDGGAYGSLTAAWGARSSPHRGIV